MRRCRAQAYTSVPFQATMPQHWSAYRPHLSATLCGWQNQKTRHLCQQYCPALPTRRFAMYRHNPCCRFRHIQYAGRPSQTVAPGNCNTQDRGCWSTPSPLPPPPTHGCRCRPAAPCGYSSCRRNGRAARKAQSWGRWKCSTPMVGCKSRERQCPNQA